MNLKVERVRRVLTQEKLSKKSKVCRLTISNIENKKVNIEKIQVGVLIRLSKALEVSVQELFFEEEN